uniref:Putative ovule protein n=1 Tax=Solanum chacoense TaxID=4108 RepID=A0A0V0GV25_SOLCH
MFDKERKVDVVNKPSATGSSDEATKRIVCFREEMKVGENINRSTAIGYPDGNVYFRGSVVRPSDGNGTCSAAPMKEKSSGGHAVLVVFGQAARLKCSGLLL